MQHKMTPAKTLYDKLIDAHTVDTLDVSGTEVLLYVDSTVLNEYTSPQAFTGLREAGRDVWRPQAALGVVDHVNSTRPDRSELTLQPLDNQSDYFARNCSEFGIELFDLFHHLQGIEHVVLPDLGLVLPGMVIAAGDSHTTTYGAFGSLGFGIGTSDIEHLLATQTLVYRRLKNLRVTVDGGLPFGTTAKDLIMTVIQQIGASGATGYAVEFAGATITALSMEGRMTICNMAVECGARGAVIAPDDRTMDYIAGRPRAPSDAQLASARAYWKTLHTDRGALFDRDIHIDADSIAPMVTWGTSPDQAMPITGKLPHPDEERDPDKRMNQRRALDYMGLPPSIPVAGIPIDHAFIGSCTNARIEDLRAAAQVLDGQRVANHVKAMVVPGSSEVRRQAEKEGLDRIFLAAGFDWRQPGCSMCLAMNDDVIPPGGRCASSTNRNFEGRQGAGSRTHLMSPAMVAAAAIRGHLCDVREIGVKHVS